jgi:hypothetical protein
MTPEEFSAALSDRLRRRGVHARPEDLRAFTVNRRQGISDFPDLEKEVDRFIRCRRLADRVRSRRGLFRRIFVIWFTVLLLSFVLANVTGAVRNMGVLPFRSTGFPFTFAEWGTGVPQFFDWSLLALNVLIAVIVSALGATACALGRCRTVPVRDVEVAAPDESPD